MQVFTSYLWRAMVTASLTTRGTVYVAPHVAEIDEMEYLVRGLRTCTVVPSICPAPRSEQRASIIEQFGAAAEARIDWSLVGGANGSNEELKNVPNDILLFGDWMWRQPPVMEAVRAAAASGREATVALFFHQNQLRNILPCGAPDARNLHMYTARLSQCGGYPTDVRTLWWPEDTTKPAICNSGNDVPLDDAARAFGVRAQPVCGPRVQSDPWMLTIYLLHAMMLFPLPATLQLLMLVAAVLHLSAAWYVPAKPELL